jgi:hypothetical protein
MIQANENKGKYLLIPVSNLEYAINLLQHLDGEAAKAKVETYQALLKNKKQISLSDSDIEKKAKSWIKETYGEGYYPDLEKAYKQALKDLLK